MDTYSSFCDVDVSCAPLEIPANAHAVHPSTRYMDEVTMFCDDGFYQTGGSLGRHVCKDDGYWQQSGYGSGQVPICKPLGKLVITKLNI